MHHYEEHMNMTEQSGDNPTTDDRNELGQFVEGNSASVGAGAPLGNRNAARYGLFSAKSHELASAYGRKKADEFRRHLEDRTVAVYGEIGVLEAAVINTATEAQRLATTNRELKAEHLEKLTFEQNLRFDSEYAKLLELRDKKILALRLEGIPAANVDPWGDIIAPSQGSAEA